MTMSRRAWPLLAVVALALAACDSSSDGSSTTAAPRTSTATTAAPTTTTSPTTAAPTSVAASSSTTTSTTAATTSTTLLGGERDVTAEVAARAGAGPFATPDAAIDAVVTAYGAPDDCEVAPTARLASRDGDDPVVAVIDTTFSCDDSSRGTILTVTIASAVDDEWTITEATGRSICIRGVSGELCV